MMFFRGKSLFRAAAATMIAVPLCAMAPGDMSVASFLSRADSVMRLGPLAMATPEASVLKNEVVGAGKRYKARIEAEKRAGRPTTSCPPASGSLTPEEWLSHLRSYPVQHRQKISVYTAFDGLMRKRYPCPVARTAKP